MSTSQRHGLRRPFGSINANTLTSSLSGASGKRDGEDSNTAKKEKKKGLLSRTRIFSSILPSGSKKKDLPQEVAVEPTALESPTKKSRIDDAESVKPSAAAAVGMPRTHVDGLKSDESNLTEAVFRKQLSFDLEDKLNNFWDNDMEEMMTLKIANPVLDESWEDNDSSDERNDSKVPKSEVDGQAEINILDTRNASLVSEVNESAKGESLLTSNRLLEHETLGFKIVYQQ